ncbi:MAG TPA: hypothetical protein VME17_06130 [Bryobacteraceae bacterium]|nr:hypothetical protein [Bryobacteraceae bacterium]
MRWLGPLLLFFTACSSAPKTASEKQPAKPPMALTGRQAFQRMYPQARGWAPDALPLQIQSINLPQVKAGDGKAGAWRVIFVSASRGKAKTYTYSAVEGDLHEGVFGGTEEDYTPRTDSSPFQVSAIRIDSDQAYKTAAAASADYIKKNPGKPVIFLMEQTRRFPDVTWRVIWGGSVGTSDYSVFVDGTTGQLLEKMH